MGILSGCFSGGWFRRLRGFGVSERNSRQGQGSTDEHGNKVADINPAVGAALSNDLILKNILEHLGVADLTCLSLVSKFWCRKARAVLRSRRTCLARIHTSFRQCSCAELVRFNTVLSQSQDPPYSGLLLRVPVHCCEGATSERCFNRVLINDLDKFAVKRLEDQGSNNYYQPHGAIESQIPECYNMILQKLNYRHLEINWILTPY